MQSTSTEIIIEIDGDVARLIEEINTHPSAAQQENFIDSFQVMLVNQLMGPFGLTRAMFDDRDGGSITTLHNFEKGVVANEADRERHSAWQQAQHEAFDRTDYQKPLPAERKQAFQTQDKIFDAYTHAELPKDGRAVRDHIISAHEIEKSARGHLAQSRAERVATANHEDNKAWTANSLNCSKSDADFIEWANRPSPDDPTTTNRERFGIDEQAMQRHYAEARRTVDGTQNRAVFTKQANEFLREGASSAGKLALRQVLGLLLKDLIQGLVQDIRYLVRTGADGGKSLWELAEERIKKTYEGVRQKWKEYLKEGVSAGVSGFLSELLTLILNAFVTTAKNIVRLIREAVVSVVHAIRVIIAPPEGYTAGDVAMEVAKILGAAVAACIGIALEEVIAKALQAIPALLPFAHTLAPVIAGIITGTLTLLTVMAFDRLRNTIAFRNKALADIHRGQAVTLLRVKKTVFMLDMAYTQVDRTQHALSNQFAESLQLVERERVKTNGSIGNYRSAVDNLDDILEKF